MKELGQILFGIIGAIVALLIVVALIQLVTGQALI